MQSEKELRQLFKSNKFDIEEDGFSRNVTNRLPEKIRIFPQIIIFCFAMIGVVVTLMIQGVSSFVESLDNLVIAINQMENLSFAVFIPCLIALLTLGSIGYAVYQSDDV